VNSPLPILVLMPGLDGTGTLFEDFVAALPSKFSKVVVRYPADRCLSYAELEECVADAASGSEPVVLLAESFSTPLAIRLAAKRPSNLAGLILCAGFAACPVRGLLRSTALGLAPILFRLPLPTSVLRALLAGRDARPPLVAAIRSAVLSVRRSVLSGRLRMVLRCDERMSLAEVGVPILYIQAEDDQLVRGGCLTEIQEIRPDIHAVCIAGPHLILQSRPKETARAVAEFVCSLGDAMIGEQGEFPTH